MSEDIRFQEKLKSENGDDHEQLGAGHFFSLTLTFLSCQLGQEHPQERSYRCARILTECTMFTG